MDKKYLILLATILIGFILASFIKNSTEFVYVNPYVNTKVMPYISKVLKEIDNGLDNSMKNMNRNGYEMHFLYKNAYGSGFLKNNPIPNDLDYAVGIHLGTYDYDGKNGEEIAKSIEDKMSTFQAEFYDYIYNLENKSLLSNFNTLGAIIAFSEKKEANIKSIETSLDKILQNKDYIVQTIKTFPDNPNANLKYPFVMKSNEILIEDCSPIQIFTNKIEYSKDTKKFLREITIVVDFFVDIKNTKTKELKHVELVAESFVGQRLQLSRRFFVPIVFTGENSANYLKNLDYLNEDEKYIEYRLFNFKRHLQEFANLNNSSDRPVKMLKRILQCSELISPTLENDLKSKIQKNISENLNNKDVQLMNDYSTALGNLIQITQLEKVFTQAILDGKMKELISSMDGDLKELKSRNNVNKNDINALLNFQSKIKQGLASVKSKSDLKNFSETLLLDMNNYNKNIISIFNQVIKNRKELLSYIDSFNKIYTQAGFHQIEMYWLNENTLGVVKDEFTSKINQKELKKMASENKLADVDYKIINKSQAPIVSVRYSTWVRYNSTQDEEKNWQELRRKLLEDKKNFNIKRKFILRF